MDDFEFKKATNTLTYNETNVVIKNRIENKRFMDHINVLTKEYKFNNDLIKSTTKSDENSYKTIRISTGSAFSKNDLSEAFAKMTDCEGN